MNTQRPEDNDSQHPGRDATLIPFPTRPGEPADAASEVLDGELLSDEENAAVARRLLGRGVNRLRPRGGGGGGGGGGAPPPPPPPPQKQGTRGPLRSKQWPGIGRARHLGM
jgi:hypothetical protein